MTTPQSTTWSDRVVDPKVREEINQLFAGEQGQQMMQGLLGYMIGTAPHTQRQGEKPKIVVVCGPPGAGKTTATAALLTHAGHCHHSIDHLHAELARVHQSTQEDELPSALSHSTACANEQIGRVLSK